MSTTTTVRTNLASLTGLRFFAAFIVVLYHVWRIYDPAQWLAPVAGFGYVGVTFFFILSGFILTWTSKVDDTPMNFYWRRFSRVWPLHLLTTIAAIGLGIALGAKLMWSSLPFVVTLTQAWVPGDTRFAFNGPSWSLANEAFFYLLFPLIIGYMARRGRPLRWMGVAFGAMALVGIVASVVIMTVSPERIGYFTYTMPPFRMGEFVIGIFLALAMRKGWRPNFNLAQALGVTVLMYVTMSTVVTAIGQQPSAIPNVIGDLWMAPAFVAVVAAGASGDLQGKSGLFRSSLAVKLGQWSFALYLIHELVLRATEPLADGASASMALVIAAGAILISIVLAAVAFEYFERPVEAKLRAMAKPKRVPAHAA
ncbi:acyltransferase family protein [Paenarthrobacter sp. NPDC057981]|uniref:acyltransferase family protein n=1 Tax=Paenarthrobacter sp. NPDC057981 TaxID=3346297 RepID=UPI0036D81B04